MYNSIKVVRIILSLVFLIILLVSYAYLPLTIDINIEGIGRIGRSFYFYAAIGTFVFINLMTYFLRFYAKRVGASEPQQLVVHSLAPVLFFSLTLLVGYITVINNAQDIDPNTYNYLNYMSAIIPIVWIVVFIYFSFKKV